MEVSRKVGKILSWLSFLFKLICKTVTALAWYFFLIFASAKIETQKWFMRIKWMLKDLCFQKYSQTEIFILPRKWEWEQIRNKILCSVRNELKRLKWIKLYIPMAVYLTYVWNFIVCYPLLHCNQFFNFLFHNKN